MARYEQYAAKLITSHEVFCNVHQAALLAEAKTAKCRSSKQVIDVRHVTNICGFQLKIIPLQVTLQSFPII
jgi:hypothetical protein